MNDEYQLLPPLSAEERAALKADIATRGILIPVEVDEDGRTLDGHHRLAIAAELGIDCPRIVRAFKTEAEKRAHVIALNLARRQLDPVRWGQVFATLLEERGVRHGQGRRNDRTSATVAEVAAAVGVSERTARHRVRLARQYEELPTAQRRLVDSGQQSLVTAVREANRDAASAQLRREASTMTDPDIARLEAELAAVEDEIKVLDAQKWELLDRQAHLLERINAARLAKAPFVWVEECELDDPSPPLGAEELRDGLLPVHRAPGASVGFRADARNGFGLMNFANWQLGAERPDAASWPWTVEWGIPPEPSVRRRFWFPCRHHVPGRHGAPDWRHPRCRTPG
jgi:ParB-like chromosome segregation protein Spo0J